MTASPGGRVDTRPGCGNPLPDAVGLGLKPEHYAEILATRPVLGFFEIHAENYFVAGGPFHHWLGRIREHYALSVHGVGLSLGGNSPPDSGHLDALAGLLDRYQPQAFSEHLAWSSHGGEFFNDLLPLPYTRATLARVVEHIDRVQSRLKRRMLLENPSTYVEFAASEMDEAEFIAEVIRRSGCGLLLDVNNLHISCTNHGRDASHTLRALPLAETGEIHLAGFAEDVDSLGAPLLIDSHGAPVAATVWKLYAEALSLTGPRPTLLERDNDIPALGVLLAEAARAQRLLDDAVRPDSAQGTDGMRAHRARGSHSADQRPNAIRRRTGEGGQGTAPAHATGAAFLTS